MDDSRDDAPPTWWAAEVENRAEGLRGGLALSAAMLALRAAGAARSVVSAARDALKR